MISFKELNSLNSNLLYQNCFNWNHLPVARNLTGGLRNNSCPWSEYDLRKYSMGGHIEILKWARENGCANSS